MNPAKLLVELATRWVGRRENDPAVRALVMGYQEVLRVPVADREPYSAWDWCALWLFALARSVDPSVPWLGRSVQVIAKGQRLATLDDVLPGDVLARLGHVAVYIGGHEVVAGNEGDAVVRRPYRRAEWTHVWRIWGQV